MPEPTVQIPFGSSSTDDNVFAVVELDSDTNVDDDGNELTSFIDSERVNILVHLESGAEVVNIYTSEGAIINANSPELVTRTRTLEEIAFKSSEDEYQLPHFPVGGVTATWEGRTGTLTVNERKVLCSVPARLADLTYSFQAWLYILEVGDLDIAQDEDFKVEVSFEVRRA